MLENVAPYNVGNHRHAPEIASLLGFPGRVRPAPAARPARADRDVLRALRRCRPARALDEQYADSHVVNVLPEGVVPELARIQQTDGAEIGVFEDRLTGSSIVVCALDNLGKGAAGQAVQNVNLLFGFEETMGLRLSGVLV